VNGKEMHPNALPESSSSLTPAKLGCWRAHANLWSRMLSEHITTALIVEDDADWDVNVHDNFALVARHMRSSNVLRGGDMTEYERKTAPYGAFRVQHLPIPFDLVVRPAAVRDLVLELTINIRVGLGYPVRRPLLGQPQRL
jgi:Glycosyltransferase family 25 (LPS biosynthesis protein)